MEYDVKVLWSYPRCAPAGRRTVAEKCIEMIMTYYVTYAILLALICAGDTLIISADGSSDFSYSASRANQEPISRRCRAFLKDRTRPSSNGLLEIGWGLPFSVGTARLLHSRAKVPT